MIQPGHLRTEVNRHGICSVDRGDGWARSGALPAIRPDWSFSVKGKAMLRWALLFLVVAIIAAIFGFSGVAADSAWIAKILFFVFIVLFVLSLIVGRGTAPPV
jgi:uncharacterized membrane protein YtjA (UPF0391 family)